MKRLVATLLVFLPHALVACGQADSPPVAAAVPTLTGLPVTATLVPTFTPMPPPATATATAPPSPTSSPTAPPTATPPPTETPVLATVPRQVDLPASHDYQRLNNCGPTTAAMTLSYYGITRTQYDIAPILKGADTDKNVAPDELSRYLTAQGVAAPVRVNGDVAMLRALLAQGIPVIVEQWLERPDDALTGHYRLVRGYDQDAGIFIVNDSYVGPNLRYSEADFDRWWRAFNRLFIPVYRPEQEPLVRAIVGESLWEESAMWQAAAARAEQELATAPDLYGWFNLGTARLRLGNAAGAVEAFDQAIALGLPERMLWYQFGPLEALNATGQYERVLQLSQPYVGLSIEEIHFQRGYALEGLGRIQDALAEYRTSASFNASYLPTQDALRRLGS